MHLKRVLFATTKINVATSPALEFHLPQQWKMINSSIYTQTHYVLYSNYYLFACLLIKCSTLASFYVIAKSLFVFFHIAYSIQ